jgi:hypothetical protein
MDTDVTSKQVGKNAPPIGAAPAIALIEPRFPHNVGAAVRCFMDDVLAEKRGFHAGSRCETDDLVYGT